MGIHVATGSTGLRQNSERKDPNSRLTSCTAALTFSFSQLRSGCSGVNSDKKYSSVALSYVQALFASPRI